MRSRELIITIIIAIILAVSLISVLGGFSAIQFEHYLDLLNTVTPTNPDQPGDQTAVPTGTVNDTTSLPVELINTPHAATTQFIPEVGGERETDLADVLLLFNSNHISNFDINFCKIAEYYGLLCKIIALNDTSLTDTLLRDEQGNYFKLLGISANTLLTFPPLLDNTELSNIKSAIEMGGVNLLVSKVSDLFYPGILVSMTDGAIQEVIKPQDTNRNWIVSSSSPEITQEFTGQIISSTSEATQEDYALQWDDPSLITPLISSTDDAGNMYSIFAYMELGSGAIFIDAGDESPSLEKVPLRELYYHMDEWKRGFAQVIPLMLAVRYSLGEEAWHNDQNFANLTIDDPALTEPWNKLSYRELLQEMRQHKFHTTIAMPPASWNKSQPTVVRLFRSYPTYYSLIQHGNNGDGYEFYKYSVSEDDEFNGQKLTARPLVDQEADILEGLSRMTEHRITTGIPYDKVMIFPWGISPEETLALLKKYNYLGTVNAQDIPLDAALPANYDYGMYQTTMDFSNFPMLVRRSPGTYQPFTPMLQTAIFDLFINKPALFYSHAYEGGLFDSGMDEFNPIADQINQLPVEVEWQSLGYILEHLCLKKVNDDGSINIKMYTNHFILTNEHTVDKTFYISKDETLNVPIQSLSVNGYEFPYKIEDDVLTIGIFVPAQSTMEILINYRYQSP